MKHRVFITGGMGFVGGRVAQWLAADSDIELVLGSRTKRLAAPSWLPCALPVTMDWHSFDSLVAACRGVDTLVHLAGMNDSECLHNPVDAWEVNTVNTARLMEAAKVASVKRVIYFSTAHIYGSRLVGTIDESTLPRPRHPYAASHRAAEDIVLAAASDTLFSIVLRLSNGFGVPAHPEVNAWMLLVNDLCRQVVTKHSISLRSSGLQQRDFITLYDVGRVVAHMINLPEDMADDGVFNVGSGKSLRIIDIAELVQRRGTEIFGFTPQITRSEPIQNEENEGFDYRQDKLVSTGFSLKGNPIDEIDEILRICNTYFVGGSL